MKISVITAVFNNVGHISSCLESVCSQTWPDIEHIIVDGGSTDGTLDIIKQVASGELRATSHRSGERLTPHTSRLTQFVSERDRGIYDALNKGIRMATGDVIGFLHSDDIYANETVMNRVAETMTESGTDSCYGDLEYVRENSDGAEILGKEDNRLRGQEGERIRGEKDNRIKGAEARGNEFGITQNSEFRTRSFEVVRYWKSGLYEKDLFKKGWMPPHPTFFVRSEVYKKLGVFNTDFRIAADYELMLRFLWKNDISTCYIPEVLVKMRLGGASNRSLGNMIRKSSEDYRAMRMHSVGGIATLIRKNISKLPQFLTRRR